MIRTRAEPLDIQVVVAGRRSSHARARRGARAIVRRCCSQYPGVRRRRAVDSARDVEAAHAAGACSWSSRRTCSRSRCSTPPGELGRRRRGRQQPALRRADGLRRPARRRSWPRATSSSGQLPGRHRRRVASTPTAQPALPARAADARAAHPPREGDVEHLHRAGAARGHGRACTPSITGPTGCAAIARARARPCAALARRGSRALGVQVAARRVLRHARASRPRAGRADARGRARGDARHQPAPLDDDRRRHLAATRRRAEADVATISSRRSRGRGAHRDGGRRPRQRRPRCPTAVAPHDRRSSRTRCSTLPRRDELLRYIRRLADEGPLARPRR